VRRPAAGLPHHVEEPADDGGAGEDDAGEDDEEAGVMTARRSISSGSDTPTAERRKASAVPSGTPLATKASRSGTVALALT